MALEGRPRAVVTKDLISEGEDLGQIFYLDGAFVGDQDHLAPHIDGLVKYRAHAYDDDGELYYHLDVYTEEGDPDERGGYLVDMLGSYAGCTELRYPGHPELDIG